MSRAKVRDPERGDIVSVEWVDICSDPTGDPDKAELARRTTYGLFWHFIEDAGVPCLVTTTTLDKDDHTQAGWSVYPVSCVTRLKVVKRTRRAKA